MTQSKPEKLGVVVKIDAHRCIANAKCTTAAPGFFVLDEETGLAVARACPTQAISIEQMGRRVFPLILTPMFGTRAAESEPDDT
jgi:ferredoxin